MNSTEISKGLSMGIFPENKVFHGETMLKPAAASLFLILTKEAAHEYSGYVEGHGIQKSRVTNGWAG